MGKANITATNVTLPAQGPIYMFKTLSGEKSNNLYQRDNTSTTFSHPKKHITHCRTAQQMQSVQLCSR